MPTTGQEPKGGYGKCLSCPRVPKSTIPRSINGALTRGKD